VVWKTRNAACFKQRYHSDCDVVIFSFFSYLTDWAICPSLRKVKPEKNLKPEDEKATGRSILTAAWLGRYYR
jgi:hypothetical protein